MLLSYQQGKVSVGVDGHSFVLQPSYTDQDGIKYPESDYNEYCRGTVDGVSDVRPIPQIVKSAFVAVKDLAERSEGKAVFNPQSATIRYGSETITPETDLTDYPADIQAFVQAVYSFNNNEQTKIWNAIQAEVIEAENREPEPLTPEQEKELARRQIIKTFEDGVKSLTSGYTDDEVKSWDAKRRESEIILSGSEEPTPTVDAICQGLGADRTEYANRINQKAQAYGAAYGALEAKMKRDLAALEE